MLYSLLASLVLCISKASSFSTLITFDVDGTLVSSSPGKHLHSEHEYVTYRLVEDSYLLTGSDVLPYLLYHQSGWEEGAHGRSFTHAVNSVLMNNEDSAGGTIPQLLEKHEFHGSTDGLILMRLARKMMGASFDKDDASSKLDLMMDTMYQFVSDCNDDEVRKGIAPLPGAIQTLETLASYEDVAFGLVTGNVEGIARRKMHALGIFDAGALTSLSQPPRLGGRVWEGMEDKRFLGGFGSDFCSGDIDDPTRNYLDRGEQLAICVQRCQEELCHPDHRIERVIHVGDAPADILAAKNYVNHPNKPQNVCISVIGVATGSYSSEELSELCGERIEGIWEPIILDAGVGVGNKEAFISACGL